MLRKLVARAAIMVFALAGGLAALATPAAAQGQVTCGPDENGGQICVLVAVSQTGGGSVSVDVTQQSSSGGSNQCVRPSTGNPVPCQHMYGWYNAATDCYLSRQDDMEPAPGHPGYDEHGDDGVVYSAFCFTAGSLLDEDGYEVLGPVTGTFRVLGPGTPDGYGGPPPSPLPRLIEEAINDLVIHGADIGMAPSPAGSGLVGLPVWMWTSVSDQTWAPAGDPQETSAQAGAIRVDASATSEHIEWTMGDGGRETCINPGTPYDTSYGVQQSPTCGYVGYRQPSQVAGGRFTVTATTTWTISWSANTGDLGDSFTVTTESSTSVLINEMQALVTLD